MLFVDCSVSCSIYMFRKFKKIEEIVKQEEARVIKAEKMKTLNKIKQVHNENI